MASLGNYQGISESVCNFEIVLNLEDLRISLLANGKMQRLLEGGIFSACLIRKASQQLDPFLLNANWNNSQEAFLLSAEIVFGAKSLLSLKLNSSSFDK
jgi:hypothetical protein